jgi:hypothetical protein
MTVYTCYMVICICCIVLTSLSWERRFQARVITHVLSYVQFVTSEEQKCNYSHGFTKQGGERVEGMKAKIGKEEIG